MNVITEHIVKLNPLIDLSRLDIPSVSRSAVSDLTKDKLYKVKKVPMAKGIRLGGSRSIRWGYQIICDSGVEAIIDCNYFIDVSIDRDDKLSDLGIL